MGSKEGRSGGMVGEGKYSDHRPQLPYFPGGKSENF